MNPQERLLVGLRIKGFGKAENLAEALGVSPEACADFLTEMKALGLADDTRVGARLTPAGRTRADAILARERADADATKVTETAERFIPVNSAFKHLITRWQMRDVDGKQVRNDHADPAYDKAVLDDFEGIHSDVGAIVDSLEGLVARFGAYRTRLEAALERIRSGDLRFVAAPDLESYHSIWFELHQDLIGLSGTTRAKEAAAGRAH
jgi:pyruvate,orthophosphate dikinase